MLACAAALSWAEMIPGVIGQQHESGEVMVMLPAGHNEILIKYLDCNKLSIFLLWRHSNESHALQPDSDQFDASLPLQDTR